jgi:small conductance mechanosensitive channel
VLGVDAFADSAVVIKARIKTRPVKQWWVGREFNRRMKKKFDELDIEIPFPHQTLYFGVDKDKTAPPANVRILSKRAEEAFKKIEEKRAESLEAVEPSTTPSPEAEDNDR